MNKANTSDKETSFLDLNIKIIGSDVHTSVYKNVLSMCNGCGMPAGNAYPSGHLVPSPIVGLACAPIVENRFLELAMSLLDFSPRMPLGTFSILIDFGFPIDNLPSLGGDVSSLPSYDVYISHDQLVRFARIGVALAFQILKICDVHTSVHDKRDDFGFSIVNFP